VEAPTPPACAPGNPERARWERLHFAMPDPLTYDPAWGSGSETPSPDFGRDAHGNG
jgi:hypothetical protein